MTSGSSLDLPAGVSDGILAFGPFQQGGVFGTITFWGDQTGALVAPGLVVRVAMCDVRPVTLAAMLDGEVLLGPLGMSSTLSFWSVSLDVHHRILRKRYIAVSFSANNGAGSYVCGASPGVLSPILLRKLGLPNDQA